MRSTPKFFIGLVLIVICTSLLGYYVFLESRDYLAGPYLSVSYPINGSEVFGPQVELRGTTKRASSITLNGSPIFIDQEGAFNQKLILPNGYNIMQFEAKDRFGKTTEKHLEFMVTSTPQK